MLRLRLRFVFRFRFDSDRVGILCDSLQLLEGVKAKSVAAKGQAKGVVVEKAKAAPKESELQTAEEALQNILKRQASDV